MFANQYARFYTSSPLENQIFVAVDERGETISYLPLGE